VQEKNYNEWNAKKIGFIGCGNLAQAIIQGLIDKKIISPSQIYVTNRTPSKVAAFCKKNKINFLTQKEDLLKTCEIIFLATKPQDILEALMAIKPSIKNHHYFVSLAAGVDGSLLKKYLNKTSGIVRIMANTPAKIQKGLFGLYIVKNKNKSLTNFILKAFSKMGIVIELKNDNQVDVITAGAASGTGFVFELLRIFQVWFLKQGLIENSSREAALNTFLGTALLAQEMKNESFETLCKAVTSKKGTTLAGLKSMKKLKVQEAMSKSLSQSKKRAVEISKSLRQSSK
jgi:pyrroline-5-carboxylate reductase